MYKLNLASDTYKIEQPSFDGKFLWSRQAITGLILNGDSLTFNINKVGVHSFPKVSATGSLMWLYMYLEKKT